MAVADEEVEKKMRSPNWRVRGRGLQTALGFWKRPRAIRDRGEELFQAKA